RIDAGSNVRGRKLGGLRPWAWGPDSLKLFEPLFSNVSAQALAPDRCFNERIAGLYSKAWSAAFLRKALARLPAEAWLCKEQEVGIAVSTLEDAIEVIAAIRARGHQRVIAKEALGLAGHNAIRLWEPELLAAQRQWLARAVKNGRQLVIEPWLERELDFS